jgi:predicted RNA-binding Zn ribbon-like protein
MLAADRAAYQSGLGRSLQHALKKGTLLLSNLSTRGMQVTVVSGIQMRSRPSISNESIDSQPRFLAGDLALDFLNTRMRVGGEIKDLLQTDEDVSAWLRRAELPVPEGRSRTKPLLRSALLLRENIRKLVEERKAERRGDPSVLNDFLRHAQSHPQLVWKKSGTVIIERVQRRSSPEDILAPIAEAAAVLLATADFTLVKRCEDETCVLWFSDQTKSHRRRWCSMETCGNRHKVAAYRARRREPGTKWKRRSRK